VSPSITSDLTHRVVDESSTLGTIVQGQTLLRFVFADKAGSSHPRIRELQVLMQVVQSVEKVAHVAAQDGKDTIVAILAHKAHEVDAHLVHEIPLRNAQNLKVFIFPISSLI